jgi:hypothetical protein
MAVAKKKKARKKVKRRAARVAPSKVKSGDVIFTDKAIVISLSPADQRRAKACLAKNGKITFAVKEHSTTRLPAVLDNGKLID